MKYHKIKITETKYLLIIFSARKSISHASRNFYSILQQRILCTLFPPSQAAYLPDPQDPVIA